MEALGYHFKAYEVDVADFDSCKNAVAKIQAEVGPVDILVNNAGITRDMTFKKMTKADWDAVIRTNLDSVFNMTKQVCDSMVERGWGRIINVSSTDELLGGESWNAWVHESFSAGGGEKGSDRKYHLARVHRYEDGHGDPEGDPRLKNPAADPCQ
jgi:NAD(P)-dependent dehydrogenase (short-subunit alcohol dehydrogenase family)